RRGSPPCGATHRAQSALQVGLRTLLAFSDSSDVYATVPTCGWTRPSIPHLMQEISRNATRLNHNRHRVANGSAVADTLVFCAATDADSVCHLARRTCGTTLGVGLHRAACLSLAAQQA